jgi:DNA polymerase I-like protein with 3'-5' exonuclease and polymerase domains
MPVQGTAGDVMKLMLIRVSARLDAKRAQIVATVHDELDIQTEPAYLDEMKGIVAEEAARVLPGMPLPMEFKVGENWGDAK